MKKLLFIDSGDQPGRVRVCIEQADHFGLCGSQ